MTLGSLIFGATLVAVALISITFHEAAHAYAAAACGDDTAKRLGRTSLNPIRHIDLVGTILLPALLYVLHSPFLIGWAKPVPVDWSQLRNWHRDMAIVAVAGPAANFVLAAASAIALMLVPPAWLAEALRLSVMLNLSLGILNLIPIPPLDGSKVLAGFLAESWALKILGARRQRHPLKWIRHNHL